MIHPSDRRPTDSALAHPDAAVTADDLARMRDGKSYEVVNGQMGPRRASVLASLVEGKAITLLNSYCELQRLGVVLSGSNGFQCFSTPLTVRKPRGSFINRRRFTTNFFHEEFLSIHPDLAVEVVSSHDEFAEVIEKVEEYLAAGIPLVWVIDPENEIVIIHRKDGSVTKLHRNDDLTGEDVLPGFTCKVAELFPDASA